MIEWIKVQALKAPFSQWVVMDKGVHLMPEQYTPYAKNIRIKSWTTTKRNGYIRVVAKWKETGQTDITEPYIDNMISDWSYLYALANWKLYKVDFNTDLTMTRYTNASFNSNTNLLRYWNYLYFLSENTAKGYYIDTSSWTGGSLTITSDGYFRFWEIFKASVWLAWWGDKSNILFKSWDITVENPEYWLNFNGIDAWIGSRQLTFRSKIMWLASTREQLFVFTEDSIEIISEWQSGEVLTITTVPIAWSNQPVNPRMVVKADDMVFFWTKENQMKSLNYMQWVTESVVWDVSHRQNLSIKDFTETLDEDQSTSFWYYNRTNKTIHRHLKQRWEPIPNIVLVYDVNTDSFFFDTNKYFNCVAEHNNKYYWGSVFWTIIYHDDIWPTDDGIAIEWERDTALFSVGSPVYRKEFREINIYWEKDDDVDINVSVLVDWKTVFDWTIKASGGWISWFASVGSATKPIAFETEKAPIKPFEYIITRWNLRHRGKKIQVIFKGNSNWDFCLSWMEIWYKDLYDNFMQDKATPNK